MNDLNGLLNFGKTITLSSGREQKVNPLKFKQFGLVSAILKDLKVNIMDDNVDIVGLVTEHYQEIIEILHISLCWPKEEIEDLYLDDLAKLILAMIEVNGDFFAQRMLPALEELKMKRSPGQS